MRHPFASRFPIVEVLIVVAIILIIGSVVISSRSPEHYKEHREAQAQHFVAGGWVKSSWEERDAWSGETRAIRVIFEHGTGVMESMVFCPTGNARALLTNELHAVIWYTGIPSVGCYTVEKVQKIY